MKKKIAGLLMLTLLACSVPVFAGPQAPDFSGSGTDGKPYALSDYKGKDLVLYFWAAWCPACVRDADNFANVYEAYKPKGIEFVTVSLDRDLDKLQALIAEKKIQYPVLFGGKAWDLPMALDYEIDSTPTYVIISKNGEIVRKGSFSQSLEKDLAKLAEHGADHFTKAPDFSGTDLQGIRHSFSDYQGKRLVLYFWATWCPACRQDTQNIQNLFPKLQEKGIEFLSVSIDKDREKLTAYVEESRVTFPVLFDGKGWDNAVSSAYSVQSTPSFVVISPKGSIEDVGNWSRELETLLS